MTRPGRHVAFYVTIVGLGLVALALVLHAGRDLDAAPELPSTLAVEGRAGDCLGDRLVTAQSGVFVDLHTAPAGGEPVGADGPRTPRVGRGRVELPSNRLPVDGHCAEGTDLAGRPYTAQLTAGHDRLAGSLTVGDGTSRPVTLSAVGDGEAAPDHGLAGSELAGRVILAVAVVVLAARLLGGLCVRLRQPPVMGEILAGILLGPSLLGLAWPRSTELLFPVEVTGALNVLAQFGLVLFMFIIGLDLDLGGSRGPGQTAVVISHVSIVVPFTLGAGAALGLFPLVATGDFAGFALFMGAAMAVTAFPVLARILTDTGLDRTRLGNLAITCAAVDDVTAWCVLSVVVALAGAGTTFGPVGTVLLTLLFGAVMFGVVRPLLARVPVIRADGLLIAGVLLSAWLTEAIGIHAIFGAFLAGVIMPRRPGLAEQLTERLDTVTRYLLLPTFFAVVGLSTRIGVLDRPELWLVLAVVIVVAVLGKWGGSSVAAAACGLSWHESSALGVLLNTRGLTEIVILTAGRDLGIVSPGLFTAMVLMALVTTFAATPLVLRLTRTPTSGALVTAGASSSGPDNVRPVEHEEERSWS